MINQEVALALFEYREESGTLHWKFGGTQFNSGDEVGTNASTPMSATQYRSVFLFGKQYKVHRIIWLMKTGVWPDGEIDHIDGDGLNNRFENLRDVTHSQNLMNAAVRKDSTSGFKGVSYDGARDRWYAYINVRGKRKMLGRHLTKQEAVAARAKAEQQLFGEFARQM